MLLTRGARVCNAILHSVAQLCNKVTVQYLAYKKCTMLGEPEISFVTLHNSLAICIIIPLTNETDWHLCFHPAQVLFFFTVHSQLDHAGFEGAPLGLISCWLEWFKTAGPSKSIPKTLLLCNGCVKVISAIKHSSFRKQVIYRRGG